MPHMNSSSDDLTFTDEVKVYKDEGDEEDQEKSAENLKEDKVGLVNEGEEKTPLEFDIYNKQYAASMFKVPFSADPRFANYFMSNYPAYINGSSNPAAFMGNKMSLMSSAVPNPFSFIPFPIHDPFAQNVTSTRYPLPDPKRIAAAAAAHFYSLPSTSQLHEAWNCDVLSQPQSSILPPHSGDSTSTTKTPSSSSNRISFSVSSIADGDKSNSSRLLSDPVNNFNTNNSVMPTGMPLSPSMFAAAAVAAAQAAAFSSSNSSPDVSSLQKAAAAHFRFLSSLHYQKQSPANNGLNIHGCYPNPGLVPSRSANQTKYSNYGPSIQQKSTAEDRKTYGESIIPDRFHQSDALRHVSSFPGDNSDVEQRKSLYSSRNSIDQGGSTSSPEIQKKQHIKKPLNAFMLFMKEMRPKVQEECTLKESAAINQILGKKWHELSREDQTKYYELARKEKELHQQLYPGWSARDNYACHSKRRKKRKLLNTTMLNSREGFLSMNMMSMNHYGSSNSNYGGSDRNPCDMRTNRPNNDTSSRGMEMLICTDPTRRQNGTAIPGIHGPGPTANGSNPKKCRARFGLEHQNLWCKPCRRKKKCVRFIYNTTEDSLAELVQTSANQESSKSDTRTRHNKLENLYLSKSPTMQNSHQVSPHRLDNNDESNSYDMETNHSFRSYSLLNQSSNDSNLNPKRSQQDDYFGLSSHKTNHFIEHLKPGRKRSHSSSSLENDDQPNFCGTLEKDRIINRTISNHSIEYHLKLEPSQNSFTSNHAGNPLSSDMMGFDFSLNNGSNAFALDKVLSNDTVSRSVTSTTTNTDSDIPKTIKWEPSIGNPQSVATISTPPTPALYSDLDFSSKTTPGSHSQSLNQTDNKVINMAVESNNNNNNSKLGDDSSSSPPPPPPPFSDNNSTVRRLQIKQKHPHKSSYEYRDAASDSSPHSPESIVSEPLQLSSITPLVK